MNCRDEMTGSPMVLDASLALKLVLPDPVRDRVRSLVSGLMDEGRELGAPSLWAYKITSTFCKAVHFGHLTLEEGRRALGQLMRLDVRLIPPDEAQNHRAFAWTLQWGRAAAYYSYYLTLAEELQCVFWTADRKLVNAVDQPWVHWLGE